jgi:broad specificity phosphatase PhoE
MEESLSAAAVPVTGPNGLPVYPPPHILGRPPANSTASTETITSTEDAGAPAASAAAAAPPMAPAAEAAAEERPDPARCERERAELRAIMRPEELARLTPAMRIDYEIMQLEREIATTCGPCDAARKKLEALRAQKPGLIPSTRFGAKKVPGACDYLDKDLRVYVYFVRHSESCANVLKRNTTAGGFMQKFFPDPELSGRGVKMAEERARLLSAELGRLAGVTQTATVSRSKLIICSSALFRAQQTAMYLSNGLTDADRISDRVVVLPYIQETGIGQENTALSDADRVSKGLYAKLPGGAASKGRIATDLFAAAPNAATPNVERFFEWLRCNIKAVYETAAGAPYPAAGLDAIRLLVVSHTGTMTDIYKRYALSATSIKHDNLEGMEVGFRIKASSVGGGMGPVTILIPRIAYSPSVSIPASCPDTMCRKPVCPTGASAAGVITSASNPEMCGELAAANIIAQRNTPTALSAAEWGSVQPVVARMARNSRSTVKALRKNIEAYKPPSGFMSVFKSAKKRINPSDTTGANSLKTKIAQAKSFYGCSAYNAERAREAAAAAKAAADEETRMKIAAQARFTNPLLIARDVRRAANAAAAEAERAREAAAAREQAEEKRQANAILASTGGVQSGVLGGTGVHGNSGFYGNGNGPLLRTGGARKRRATRKGRRLTHKRRRSTRKQRR